LDLCRYNHRHDSVLSVLADTVKEKLPPSMHFSADLGSNYNSPELNLYPCSIKYRRGQLKGHLRYGAAETELRPEPTPSLL